MVNSMAHYIFEFGVATHVFNRQGKGLCTGIYDGEAYRVTAMTWRAVMFKFNPYFELFIDVKRFVALSSEPLAKPADSYASILFFFWKNNSIGQL